MSVKCKIFGAVNWKLYRHLKKQTRYLPSWVKGLLWCRSHPCGSMTGGQPAHSNTSLGLEMCLLGGTSGVCDQSCHTHGNKMSLPGRRVRLTLCLIGSQPASQLASCNWSSNQLCDKISTCQALSWSDGGRRIWGPSTLGPSPGSQHSQWFPLGGDLPYQSQASDTNELCSLLYTTDTTFRDCLQFCIHVT